MSTEWLELIQLHQAMLETFNVVHLRRICRGLPKVDYDNLPAEGRRDKIRELLLAAQRRELIPRLIELCRQIEPGFAWQEVNLDALFPVTEAARRIDAEAFIRAVAAHFDRQDLDQLCFYLGVKAGDTSYRVLLDGIVSADLLSPGTRRRLEELGIDYERLPRQEVEALVKELWAESFVGYCQRRGLWERAVAVCLRLRPDAFEG